MKRISCLVWVLALLPLPASAQLTLGSQDGPGAKLYGFARLDVIYSDTHLSHPQYPELVPNVAEKDDDLSVHPRLSRFGFSGWSGALESGLELSGKIEIDFQNGGSESRAVPRLRHGYGQLAIAGFSLLAGQTWQLASQLYPSANADSMMWNSGNTGDRSPQIRLGYRLAMGDGGSLQIQAAMLMPNTVDKLDRDGNGYTDGADAAMGTYQGRLAFEMPLWTSKPFRVAVGGHVGKETYDDGTGTDNENVVSPYGVFAELEIPLIEQLALRGEWFMGRALTDVRGGAKQSLNPSGDAISTMGFWGELWAKPIDVLTLSVGYGQDDPDDVGEGGVDKNAVIWGTVGYRPAPSYRIQAEYHRWMTDYLQSDKTESRDANRVNLHFTWFF